MINHGQGPLELHVILDAHAVFSAITAEQVRPPNEGSLLYEVRAMRDRLESTAIKCVHRADTHDMSCEALTEGSVSRTDLLKTFALGHWSVKITEQLHSWSAPKSITSVALWYSHVHACVCL